MPHRRARGPRPGRQGNQQRSVSSGQNSHSPLPGLGTASAYNPSLHPSQASWPPGNIQQRCVRCQLQIQEETE